MHLDIYKKLNEVRKLLPPVFDVQEFAHFFPEKTAPLKFCERLVHQGLLIRLKRGTYAYHEVNALVAANYIAPCSYVSFESALSYYGMIPEFTLLIMSVSSVSRHRSFTTPIASSEYFHQQAELYAAGMDLIFVNDDKSLAPFLFERERELAPLPEYVKSECEAWLKGAFVIQECRVPRVH